jgi:hypothetical protein
VNCELGFQASPFFDKCGKKQIDERMDVKLLDKFNECIIHRKSNWFGQL